MDERAIYAIEDYMYDLFEPGGNWPDYEFRKRSYERWAALEISKRIQDYPNIPSIEIVQDFVHKTDIYSEVEHDDWYGSFLFRVAHDVAVDILDILRAMN